MGPPKRAATPNRGGGPGRPRSGPDGGGHFETNCFGKFGERGPLASFLGGLEWP